MKVVKLEGNIRVCFAEVDKQPTIQVGLGGNVKVTLDDGRKFEDKDLTWDDEPAFKCKELSNDENKEITNQINEDLRDAASRISNQIREISVGIAGGRKIHI